MPPHTGLLFLIMVVTAVRVHLLGNRLECLTTHAVILFRRNVPKQA